VIRRLVPFLLVAVAACAPAPRAYLGEPLAGRWRVAVLPLANFTSATEAPDRLGALLSVELSRRGTFDVIEPGNVEEALADQPWILTDRIPPDLVDSLGVRLGADALLVGSILAYGTVGGGEDAVPQVSIALRLIETPGGKVIWSAVHNRDGTDRETVFGFGRTSGLERLAAQTVEEIVNTIPIARGSSSAGLEPPRSKGESTP
jgi:hypothetical protein